MISTLASHKWKVFSTSSQLGKIGLQLEMSSGIELSRNTPTVYQKIHSYKTSAYASVP